MLKNKLVLFLLLISLVLTLTINPFIEWRSASAIDKTSKKALNQIVNYSDIKANFLQDTIVINEVSFLDGQANSDLARTNVTAENIVMDMDFTMAIWRDIQVNNVTLNNVDISLDYQVPGQSNIHDIQEYFHDYLVDRARNKAKLPLKWNVDLMVLNNIAIAITDAQLGNIGTLTLAKVSIPQLSSQYAKKQNKQIVLNAILSSTYQQWQSGTLKGNFDNDKLGQFIAREAKILAKIKFNENKGMLLQKAALAKEFILKKLKERQGH